jgi:hypothetical protein
MGRELRESEDRSQNSEEEQDRMAIVIVASRSDSAAEQLRRTGSARSYGVRTDEPRYHVGEPRFSTGSK